MSYLKPKCSQAEFTWKSIFEMPNTQLAGKVALVTGANRGIGAATVRALANVGASILLTYSGEQDDPMAARLVTSIRQLGGRAASIAADLNDPDLIPSIFELAEAQLGVVDILVNNAAHSERDDLATITASSIDRHYAVNVRAMLLACQEYVRRRGNQLGGRIINLSSGVVEGAPQELAYSASKGAIETLTRGLAKALAARQITVNAVSPGPTDTGWLTPAMRDELAGRTPLRRIGLPEDIANVVVFLASAQSDWITGQIIDAGGGWHMRF